MVATAKGGKSRKISWSRNRHRSETMLGYLTLVQQPFILPGVFNSAEFVRGATP
jgi:hypothetical protein